MCDRGYRPLDIQSNQVGIAIIIFLIIGRGSRHLNIQFNHSSIVMVLRQTLDTSNSRCDKH